MGTKTCNQPPTYRLRPPGRLRVPIAAIFMAAFLLRGPSPVGYYFSKGSPCPAAAVLLIAMAETERPLQVTHRRVGMGKSVVQSP